MRSWPLLALPFAGLVYGPLYATHDFYAFEAGCVLLAVVLSWFVYRPERRPGSAAPEAGEQPRFSRDPSIRRYPSARKPRSRSLRA